jgi:hypothetical protein
MSTNRQSFIMPASDFKDFLSILKMLSDVCNDMHLVDGKMLQQSNDRTSIIGCDLSSIFQIKGTYIFSDIKHKMKNLNVLNKSCPIIFKLDDEKMEIDDGINYIDFKLANERLCDNKKMTEEEVGILDFTKTRLLEADLPKDLCRNIAKLCQLNNSLAVQFGVVKNHVTLGVAITDPGIVYPKFKFGYTLCKQMNDVSMNFSAMPFGFNRAMTLAVDLTEDELIALCKMKIVISGNIFLDVYGKASVRSNSELEE